MDRTFRKSIDACELTPTSFAIFTFKCAAIVSKQSVEILSVGQSPKYRFVNCDNASAHHFLRNTENKLVLPQPPTEETFSVQWSSVVEQLTYRTMTSNFIKLLLR